MTGKTVPLQLIDGGEPAADWEAVYRENVTLVFRFIHARTGNRADAEDLTSQVFLRALPRLEAAAAPAEVRAYLIQTARTAIADFWSAHYRIVWGEPVDDNLPEPPAPERGDERRPQSRVERILAHLSPTHRRILELRFLRGYSVKETAAAMGITVTNAKVTQYRALRQAATVLEDAE